MKTWTYLEIGLGALAVVVLVGVYLFASDGVNFGPQDTDYYADSQQPTSTPDSASSTKKTGNQPASATSQVIGSSVQGRAIRAYTFGTGKTRLLFVGAIHGGYEYNSALLSYRLIDYLRANPESIPEGISVSVIPQLNPDGVAELVDTSGRFTRADVPNNPDLGGNERFNASGVDLNRNFACNWQTSSQWRGESVDAGTSAFSEPEAKALRDYVSRTTPDAAVLFHSAAGAVYGATCSGSVGPKTSKLLDTYARASGYRAVPRFTAYQVTGDAGSWLTSLGIPAVSVELTDHQNIEWSSNLAGIKAMFDYYSQ
jgi:hypothetical protein